MEQLTSLAAQRAWSRARRQQGETIALVPTMGALHRGHLSLVERARTAARRVVVSIFVNPTQFDRPEDFAAYPITLEQDLALLEQAGVDAVYLPTVAEMYPDGYATFVEVVGSLVGNLCGVARPGHFRGVATVVTKLFNAVQPDVAVFGEKDLQQVLVISRMIQDLQLPVELQIAPTIRDQDGLPLSSRNQRLSAEMRQKALGLPQGLEAANRAYKAGERAALKLTEKVYDELLVHPGVDVDYAEVVKLPSLEEVEFADDRCVLAAAAFIDGVRLIDHVYLGGESIPVAMPAD